MSSHGLLAGHPPPNRDTLLRWLESEGVYVASGLEVCEMEDGEGWRVVARRALGTDEISECMRGFVLSSICAPPSGPRTFDSVMARIVSFGGLPSALRPSLTTRPRSMSNTQDRPPLRSHLVSSTLSSPLHPPHHKSHHLPPGARAAARAPARLGFEMVRIPAEPTEAGHYAALVLGCGRAGRGGREGGEAVVGRYGGGAGLDA
jgi:hypothetical protein